MSTMPTLRDILNDTPANAVDVDWNFGTVEQYIADEVVVRDGSVAMTGQLNLLGPAPSAAAHAVNKQYIDQVVIPVGTIWQFAGPNAPAGWALCDGSSKSTTDPIWAPLFAVIQYTYGGAGGQFNLPDLRGRMPVGRNSGDASFDALGEKAGTKDATVLLSHSHTVNSHTHDLSNHQHVVPEHGHGGAVVDTGHHQHLAAQAVDTFFAHGREGTIQHAGGTPGNTFADLHNLVTDLAGAHGHGLVINNAAAAWTNQINNNGSGPSSPGTTPASSGTAANANLPPYIVLNFIVRIG